MTGRCPVESRDRATRRGLAVSWAPITCLYNIVGLVTVTLIGQRRHWRYAADQFHIQLWVFATVVISIFERCVTRRQSSLLKNNCENLVTHNRLLLQLCIVIVLVTFRLDFSVMFEVSIFGVGVMSFLTIVALNALVELEAVYLKRPSQNTIISGMKLFKDAYIDSSAHINLKWLWSQYRMTGRAVLSLSFMADGSLFKF